MDRHRAGREGKMRSSRGAKPHPNGPWTPGRIAILREFWKDENLRGSVAEWIDGIRATAEERAAMHASWRSIMVEWEETRRRRRARHGL